jgi:hypothetical protein
MKPSTAARAISVVLVGAGAGLWVRLSTLKMLHMGRDAFLATQAARFDRFDRLIGQQHSVVTAAVAGVLVLGALIGLYELVVLVVARILARNSDSGGSQGS